MARPAFGCKTVVGAIAVMARHAQQELMDRFQSFQLFVRVVENGSFSLTAKETSISQATVSKQVSELEQFLGVTLMTRTTRRLHLTEAGERFYGEAKQLLEQFDQVVGGVRSLRAKPSGTLRLATAIMFGRRQVAPLLPRFQQAYPDIVIEHYLSDALTDLVKDGIDLAIKVGDLKDSTHLARRLGSTRRVTVASPAFVEKHGMPTHPLDLATKPCLVFLGQNHPLEWTYRDGKGGDIAVSISGNYRADATEALREAAIAGLGVYRTPLSTCGDDILAGRLVQMLKDFEPEPVALYAVMPNSAFVPEKTRVFIDFLKEQFRHSRWISQQSDAPGAPDPEGDL